MTKKKSNVFLKSSYNYHAGEQKSCGYWDVYKMNKWLEQLKSVHIAPESCISSIYTNMTHTVQVTRRGHSYISDYSGAPLLTISIYPINQKCKIKDKKNCAKCIAAGKCRDEFVINLIGKTLFPNKYNEKQK